LAIVYIGQLLENYISTPNFWAQIFLLLFHSKSFVLIFTKGAFGYIYVILHERIWSPCLPLELSVVVLLVADTICCLFL
jgi:hypothetical protein